MLLPIIQLFLISILLNGQQVENSNVNSTSMLIYRQPVTRKLAHSSSKLATQNRVRYFKPVRKEVQVNPNIRVYRLTTRSPLHASLTTARRQALTQPRQHRRMNPPSSSIYAHALSTQTMVNAKTEKSSAHKRNFTIDFLTNVNFFLNKLEKEMEKTGEVYELKKYSKKFLNLVRSQLKPAYEEMKANICNFLDDNDEDMDDGNIYNKRNDKNENLIEAMYKRDQRRRMARFSQKRRIIRRICY